MTGPVAAARPLLLLRPGPTILLLKQLSGPAILLPSPSPSLISLSRPLIPWPARSRSFMTSAGSLACSIQQARRTRLYSTNPPKPGPEEPSQPHEDSKSTSESSFSPSSSSSSPSSAEEPTSQPQSQPQEQEQEQQQDEQKQQPPSQNPNEPELPSQADSRRSALSQNISHFMDNLQSRVLVASQTLNDLTGYSAIERIKQANAQLETDLAAAQAELRRARAHYQAVNARRAATQREVTTLLARKDTWAPADLERFTALYRTDHELEAAVHAAAAALTEAEAEEARLSQALNNGILKRYHEEQIWSDRIRRQSTWGTWGLMGVNFLMFLILQFVAEPWRRRRLMRGIAAEEKAALDAVRKELEEVRGALAGLDRDRIHDEAETEAEVPADAAATVDAESSVPVAVVAEEAGFETSVVPVVAPEFTPMAEAEAAPSSAPMPAAAPPKLSWTEFLSDPSRWRLAAEDLYSDRRIDLRMRDITLIALQGAMTGAAVVASAAFLLARRG